MGRFVVQEHHARTLHWDFRLEIGGVLKSWVLPKGPTLDPHQKHLAIAVPDHPLAYGDYEGVIPPGHFGAGPVVIWDRGFFEPIDPPQAGRGLRRGRFSFYLNGHWLRGGFSLIKMRGKGREAHWLLIKRLDRHAQPGWAVPSRLEEKSAGLQEIPPPCALLEDGGLP